MTARTPSPLLVAAIAFDDALNGPVTEDDSDICAIKCAAADLRAALAAAPPGALATAVSERLAAHDAPLVTIDPRGGQGSPNDRNGARSWWQGATARLRTAIARETSP
jgi:hypothetical protein